MWKQVGLVLTVAAVGLSSGSAEARFGKASPPSSGGGNSGGGGGGPRGGGGGGGGSPSHGGGGGGGHSYGYPRGGYYGGSGYYGGYGYYGYPYSSYYYFDPTWAWPFMGTTVVPGYGRYYGYDANWRRPRPTPGMIRQEPLVPAQMDLRVDTGMVKDGYSVNLGLQLEGQRFGFGAKLDLFNLAATDGLGGRDAISLLSLGPSLLVVSNERLKWRVTGGMDVAFAPDITMLGLGLGTGARYQLAGPLKLEAHAHLTPLPYIQVAGDAGLAVDLGSVLRLRAGYRATYLDDRGNVDGISHKDLLAGPFAGVSLAL